RGLRRVAHSGGDAGDRSQVLWFPDEKFGVAVLSNLSTFNPGRLSEQVAEIYLADKLAPEKAKSKPADLTTVKVDPAAYDKYVGKYVLQNGPVVDITKENDKLYAQPTGGAKLEMIPQSEIKFLLTALDFEITFDAPEKGKASKFIVRQGGRDIPA